jgi:hypothetical protein
MLKNLSLIRRQALPIANLARHFSSGINPVEYKKVHTPMISDPKFYENEFMMTSIEEIDYVRSPMYDYAKSNQATGEQTEEMMEDLSNRTAMIDPLTAFLSSPMPTRDNTAFFRYGDKVIAPEVDKHIF